MRVTVDNRIRLPLDELSDDQLERLRKAFRHRNPASKPGNDEPTEYLTWEADDREVSFPRGGEARVRRVLETGFQERDERTWSWPAPYIPDHAVEQRGYQREMISAAEREQTCLLRAPTGSGKTTAALGLIARLKRKSLVMVWTGALEKQWRERVAEELGVDEASVGRIRGRHDFQSPITVAMQQTIVRRFAKGDRELAGAFDVVVCDEVQRFAAPTLFASVDPFRARYRVGISADETRKDGKEFLTRDLFGEVAASVDEVALIESGAIVEVETLVVPTDFRANWYRYRQDWNRLLKQMCADEARNALLLSITARMVRDGEQVLVFTHRVEHARDIDARLTAMGIRAGTLLGGADNAVTFERTKVGMKVGTVRVGVGTYQAIAQGLDLPSVSRGICATPVANNRQQIGQVRGRICRSSGGKSVGKLVVLWDREVYGRRTVENLARWHRVAQVLVDRRWVDATEYLRAGRARS